MTNNHEIENLIEKLQNHQTELLKVHELYLKNDQSVNHLIQQIAGTELSLLSDQHNQPVDERALSTIEKRAESLVSQHKATCSAHQAYIQSQADFTRQYAGLIQGLLGGASGNIQGDQSISHDAERANILQAKTQTQEKAIEESIVLHEQQTETALQAESSLSAEELRATFLKIVSEKTGYPVDMLELEMDMEADLGIDSIKRVEILGAMQEQYPELPSISAEDLVELRTLAQVIGAFRTDAIISPRPQDAAVPSHSTNPPETGVKPQTADSEEVRKSFLEIVSEKTGYPVDMLELGMDMEADLGIDSIKRVEILGGVQEKYPQLPTISAEQLVELRTLEQVIGAFQADHPTQDIQQRGQTHAVPVAVSEKPESAATAPADEIKAAFLAIVSEKTGYPADMLELDMDMEADLGIDSIKRVEILGAVQEKYPQLPSISAEEMVELRTLAQLMGKFSSEQKSDLESASKEMPHKQVKKTSPVSAVPVVVKPLPRPDQVSFDAPEGSSVLITAEDSEKAARLAQSFIGRGLKASLIHLNPNGHSSDSKVGEGCDQYAAEDGSEKAIEDMMARITADHQKVVAFFHLEPAQNEINGDPLNFSDQTQNSLKSVFLIARSLKKPLSTAASETRPAFITVTQMDGHFGLNGYKAADPLPGGFAGLTKTLRQEWPNVFCRALDFHPQMNAEDVVDKIQAEFHDADLRLSEVGYTADGRFTIEMGEKGPEHA